MHNFFLIIKIIFQLLKYILIHCDEKISIIITFHDFF